MMGGQADWSTAIGGHFWYSSNCPGSSLGWSPTTPVSLSSSVARMQTRHGILNFGLLKMGMLIRIQADEAGTCTQELATQPAVKQAKSHQLGLRT
jgi:hypothetical protein